MLSQKDPYIFAIDLGTSGPKVALVTAQGEVLGCEWEPNRVNLLPGGGAEQDPADWWQAITTAAHRLLDQRLVPVESIRALSCTTQWSGTVPVDRGGKPLMNAIIWMDSRGAPYIDQVVRGILNVEGYGIDKLITWIRLTGGIPARSGKDPIAHILYIKHELPEIYAQTNKFLEPKDYLNLKLTGQIAAGFDSICLHWVTDNRQINQVRYDDRLLGMAHLEREKLPDLRQSTDILGTLTPESARDLGLGDEVQVVVGAPDMQSAAIGSGAVRDFEAHLYLGTSSWLACHVPFKKTDLRANIGALPSGIPGKYLMTDEQEIAGGSLTFLRDSLLFPNDGFSDQESPEDFFERLNRAAGNAAPGSDKLIFTPWLYGERAPVDDPTVRGGFFNLTLRTTREEMIRAVMEGVAYNNAWLLKYAEKFIGRKMEAINLVGGGARSSVWCQIFADVLNRPIRQMKDPVQANVRGAAYLASVALKCITFDDIPGHTQVAQTYQPNPDNRAIYDELLQEFVHVYERNKPIYARLNRQMAGG